jgi:hypothetical protein
MTHFNLHFELIGISLDQFTKINATFRRVEENGFTTIPLNLDIRDFHLKIQ